MLREICNVRRWRVVFRSLLSGQPAGGAGAVLRGAVAPDPDHGGEAWSGRRQGIRAVVVRASLLAAVATSGGVAATGVAHADGLCRKLTFEGVGHVVCEISLRDHQVRMYLRGADGQPYGRLSRLVDSPAGRELVMAINGGMYGDDRGPVGLFVEGGKQLRAANTRRGSGNFHMKPNGVFYVTASGAGVLTTERYLRQKPRALYATQSGPMLVIDGKLHPRFAGEGQSLKIRNGVGVRGGGTVVFAISDQPVSFGSFARLFRDVLKTPDALYLDGSISSIYAPDVGRRDWLYPVGPIIGVAPRAAPGSSSGGANHRRRAAGGAGIVAGGASAGEIRVKIGGALARFR